MLCSTVLALLCLACFNRYLVALDAGLVMSPAGFFRCPCNAGRWLHARPEDGCPMVDGRGIAINGRQQLLDVADSGRVGGNRGLRDGHA